MRARNACALIAEPPAGRAAMAGGSATSTATAATTAAQRQHA